MSRRLNRESCPCKSQGPHELWIKYVFNARHLPQLELRGCLVNDLSGHTDCCGSECKLFHLGSLVCNSLYSALDGCTLPFLVVSVYTLRVETTV